MVPAVVETISHFCPVQIEYDHEVVSESHCRFPVGCQIATTWLESACRELSLGCCLWMVHSAVAIQQWNNPNVGATAGNWFNGLNWTPAVVPDSTVVASINNAGEAVASAGGPITALQVDVGKNGGAGQLTTSAVSYQLQSSLDVGVVEAAFAVGPVNVVAQGTASLSGAALIDLGLSGAGDLNAGQTSAGSQATAQGTGGIILSNIGTVRLPGDFDVGQTSGDGQATGHGTAHVSDITNVMTLAGDLDIGQTAAGVMGHNTGMGTVMLDRVANFQVGTDVDVGQTTGEGRGAGTGSLMVTDSTMSIGDSLDVGKIRSFNSGDNRAIGNVMMADSTVSVGFTTLGSVEIARVLVSEAARGISQASLTLDNVNLMVADNVIIGELDLGGSNTQNSAQATLSMNNSQLETGDLRIAQRLNSTQGTLSGRLELTRSLAKASGSMALSPTATVVMDIAGTDRSMGEGLDDDYSAIDADLASLAGILEVQSIGNYIEPDVRGESDAFLLIQTLFGYTGVFDEVRYGADVLVDGADYVGASDQGTDGLFRSLNYAGNDVVITNYLALPGDANGDGSVDGSDFGIWNANKFSSNANWSLGDFNGDGSVDGSDFGIWNTHKFTSVGVVPEPGSPCVLMGGLLCLRRRRWRYQISCDDSKSITKLPDFDPPAQS